MGGGGQFTLQPDNDYQLRMVVNKAKAAGANGLPLILGGSIDLRDGFTFTTWAPIEVTPLQTLSGHSNIVWSVAYNRDGTLASASHDGTIRLWDAESGLELQTMGGHNGPISSVAYSPDGTTLASASFDGTIKLWHAATGQELQQSPLSGHSDIVFSVAYSPDGTTLASASFSVLAQQALNEDFHDPNDPQGTSSLSNIQLWEVDSGSLWKTLSGHTGPIKSVAYNPVDGTTLASASDDGTIKLWHVATAEMVKYPEVQWVTPTPGASNV